MPIYEYECRKCQAHLEVLQKITDKPLTKCHKCGGRLEKQWSPTSFQLKGTGWYMTDYAGKKAETKEESKKAETKEEKGTKAESAPAGDKATPQETSSSKKRSTPKPAPSSSD